MKKYAMTLVRELAYPECAEKENWTQMVLRDRVLPKLAEEQDEWARRVVDLRAALRAVVRDCDDIGVTKLQIRQQAQVALLYDNDAQKREVADG